MRVGVSVTEQNQLLPLYASFRHIPAADISAAVTGTAQGAELPATGQNWAAVKFVPSATAPASVAISFQDGAGTGIFTRSPSGNWQVAGLASAPFGCGTNIPAAVLQAWSEPTCAAAVPPSATAPEMTPAATVTNVTSQLALIARSQIGVSDNPPEHSFGGLDCNPYTALEVSWASKFGCGVDPTFRITDASELWCADFAKWVWRQAGVSSDVGVLTGSAATFYTWGHDHHEIMRKDPKNPQVGDAVVFYPGTKPNGGYADHVGIISAVNRNGTVNIINGDFLGPNNISVQADRNVTVAGFASGIFGAGETWTFVSPDLRPATRDAAEVRGAASRRCIDTWHAKFANGTRESIWNCHNGPGQKWTYNSRGELTIDSGKYCLDVRNRSTANGSGVQLWSCTGRSNQQWTFGPDGSLVGTQSGKCLSVNGGHTGNNSELIIEACTGRADERWSWL